MTEKTCNKINAAKGGFYITMGGENNQEPVLFELVDGVAKIVLNRPAKLNSLTERMFELLMSHLDSCKEDGSVRSVILTGSGRGFCAGQDLGEREGGEIDLSGSLDKKYNPVVRRIISLPKPVVCGLNGVAAGAGCSFALACDIIIAAKSAKLIQAFAGIGLVPDSGATWALPRMVGLPRAKAMSMLATPIEAETAHRWGMVWDCCEDDELAEKSFALAKKLATGPTAAYGLMKKAFLAQANSTLDEQLDYERDLQGEAGNTDDYKEGIEAFLEKRPPKFKGS